MSDFLDIPEDNKNDPNLNEQLKDAAINAKVKRIMSKAMWTEEDEKKFEQHMDTDPNIQAFFAKFSDYSIDSFKKSYLKQRKDIMASEATYLLMDIKYPDIEEENLVEYFWLIQQKKLFEKQCLWRAKQLDIPQIKVSHDFLYWSLAIKYCPFIDPVQPDEVELLRHFLLEYGYKLNFERTSAVELQDYDSIKNDGDVPSFFAYWDEHYGTEHFLNLPDVRGPIEEHYYDQFRKEGHAKSLKEHPEEYSTAKKPHLSTVSQEHIERFVTLSEDIEFKKIYPKYLKDKQLRIDTEDYDIAYLDDNCEKMPAHYELVNIYPSWRQNIAATVSKYVHECYANELDRIYDMYLMEREMDLDIEFEDDDLSHLKSYEDITKNRRRGVLRGREILGEPADWSFL